MAKSDFGHERLRTPLRPHHDEPIKTKVLDPPSPAIADERLLIRNCLTPTTPGNPQQYCA
jgi:hypothetical protein